jgi:hypothetical protein
MMDIKAKTYVPPSKVILEMDAETARELAMYLNGIDAHLSVGDRGRIAGVIMSALRELE